MPNWCENDLYVHGPKEELAKFQEAVKGTDRHGEEKVLCEDRIIPYPETFLQMDKAQQEYRDAHPGDYANAPKDGFNSGGYEWCRENWGTKWGFCHPVLDIEEEELLYTFDTAWSPPLPLIKKLGEMFPNLEFDLRYFESGAGFNGLLHIEQGQVVEDRTGEYFGDRGG